MTPEELKQQLDTLKASLETSIEKKLSDQAKEELKKQIVELEAKLAKAAKDSAPDIDPLKKELETTKKEVETLKATIVTKDEKDKLNQEAIDTLLSDVKALKTSKPRKEDLPSFGEALEAAFNEGDNFKNIEMLANNHKDRNKRFSIQLKTVGDVLIANYTGGTRALTVLRPGIIQIPPRKVHVRDLVPNGTIGAGTEFVFMRENGLGEGAIAPVAEGVEKPQIDIDLIESSVKIETIAGWLRVTRKAMNNIPGFLSFLQARLPDKLLRVEDAQLLTGSGVSPNIKGIMTAGNYTSANTSATVLIEQLIDSLAQLEDEEERTATGILLRPVDYFGFFKNKATGSGEYDLPQNTSFINGVLYISGVPVFTSTALPADNYIVGDWQMGAQLLIQEGMRIEFFEQDGDNVRTNKITVRIEETIAFPVYGDNYFIVGDIGAS